MGKNGKDYDIAQKNLAGLLEELQGLDRRRDEIERELSALVVASPEAVRRLQALQQDLSRVVSSMTATRIAIEESERVFHVARARDAEGKLAELRKGEEPLVRDLVQALIALRDRMLVLNGFHVQLASLGGAPWMGPPAILVQAVRAGEAWYTTYFPHILGLPARLSHLQEQQQSVIADCQRQLDCFAAVEQLLRGDVARFSGRVRYALEVRRASCIENFKLAEKRCRELGCSPPGSAAMIGARMQRAATDLAQGDFNQRMRERYGTDAPDEPEAAEGSE